MSRRYDYTGPLNADGHPVGCQCWTCYLGSRTVQPPSPPVPAPRPPDDKL